MPHSDQIKRKEYLKQYSELNKDKLKEYRREWYIKNKGRIKARDGTSEKKELKRIQNQQWSINNRIKRILISLNNRAKERNLEFSLDESSIIIPESCPILGIPLFFTPEIKTDNTPSVDRIDNSKGYIDGNVWVISWKANRIKNNAALEELVKIGDWAKDEILKHRTQ